MDVGVIDYLFCSVNLKNIGKLYSVLVLQKKVAARGKRHTSYITGMETHKPNCLTPLNKSRSHRVPMLPIISMKKIGP